MHLINVTSVPIISTVETISNVNRHDRDVGILYVTVVPND